MKRIKYIILTLGVIGGFGLAAIPSNAGAFNVFSDACSGSAAGTAICTDSAKKGEIQDFVKNLVNAMLYVLGAVAVIVIIFAGVFYVTSMGDATAITKAKNTLLYAVIGLVVALLAYAIVNFVLTSV
jgi:uncharacterized protein YacL